MKKAAQEKLKKKSVKASSEHSAGHIQTQGK
jgi:hypothetical protein